MRVFRAAPRAFAHDVRRVRERETRRSAFAPWLQQSTRVIEVQVGEDDDVHVLGREPELRERFEKDVTILLHAEALAELRLEESPDARFAQDVPTIFAHEKRPA